MLSNLDLAHSQWPYLVIFLAAVVEGEVVFVAASGLAGIGVLNTFGVWAAAGLGGSVGDQVFFYVSRAGVRSRLFRIVPGLSSLKRAEHVVIPWIRRRSTPIILLSRFLPGLRVAIPVSCAYAGVGPARFSMLSLCSGFLWAGAILWTVAYLGPQALGRLGLGVTWAIIVAAIGILLLVGYARKSIQRKLHEGNVPSLIEKSGPE
jgi:membrane protein DedA with SNARE-associated domain